MRGYRRCFMYGLGGLIVDGDDGLFWEGREEGSW